MDINKQNIGNAGEYYFASRLSALNFTVTITLGRAERYDIIAISPKGKAYKFSVKTRLITENLCFTLSEKDERKFESDLYYVFIRLHGFEKEPEYWIIPSKYVAEVIASAHKKWKNTPGRKGQKHNKNSLRKLPIILRGADARYYPASWEIEVKKYHNNISSFYKN